MTRNRKFTKGLELGSSMREGPECRQTECEQEIKQADFAKYIGFRSSMKMSSSHVGRDGTSIQDAMCKCPNCNLS